MGIEEKVVAAQQLIARFANCFDTKDWKALGACLADNLYTDYSDLRRVPPKTVTREEFVSSRQSALDGLKTHHLFGNIEASASGSGCDAKASMVIYRRNELGQVLNTHCLYIFGIKPCPSGWEICSITQRVLWSEGQESVHPGIVAGNV